MHTRYLCLDDEVEKVKPIVEVLENSHPNLSIEIRSPYKFDDEVRQLTKFEYDGFLFDLRLDRGADTDGQRVNYRALALAQELRTRMTEDGRGRPMILWSVDDNFKLSYDKDETSHDLFDKQYYKANITKDGRSIATEMIDLANGYMTIGATRSKTVKNPYSRLIDLPSAFEILDPRIAQGIADDRAYPAHVFARSILSNLIFGNGPLIDERTLAARLGIDLEKSADWTRLLDKFAKPAKYTGVFGTAWPRWWMHRIVDAWSPIADRGNLQRMEATQRVALLKKHFKLPKLEAAPPVADGCDQRYWYVCKFLKIPISPVDAVQLFVDRREWQDGIYASVQAILDRRHKADGYELHPFERERIEDLIQSLKNG